MRTIKINTVDPDRYPFGLTPLILARLQSIFQNLGSIEAVIIYGSRAKGTYKAGSDIDLTIKGSAFSLAELAQVENQIDDLYLPYSVDLSQYEQLKNCELIDHIDRVGVVIYAKNDAG